MKKYFNSIRKCTLFDDINDEQLKKMLVCLGARVESFDKKYTVMAEGSPAKYLGIVLSGSCQIIRTDYYGNRSILAEVGESELFGEAFSCAEMDSVPVNVIANEPSEIMLINASHILSTCENSCGFHKQLIFNLMKDLARKTIVFNQKIEVISKRTTREKLMTYLMMCAKRAGSDGFNIPFDRQELADYLEVERSGLSAEIAKLRREGILESTKNYFKLL